MSNTTTKYKSQWPWLRDLISRGFWRYLLTDCRTLTQFWCRFRGHPYDVKWFTFHQDSPDMRCKNCGEDLG